MHKIADLPKEFNTRFCPKKKQSRKLSRVYKRLGYDKKSKRVNDCGSYIEFGAFRDGSVRLSNANFCKDIFCPMCAWRKELKLFDQVSRIVDVLQSQHFRFIFVTLTMRNCLATGEALKSVLNDYNKAYLKLTRLKRIKGFLKGSFKSIEVTYNDETDTFHPHMHIIWVVPNEYFSSSEYLNQSELCELWKKCLKIDYTPICDIRAVTGKKLVKNGKYLTYDLKSAVAEICKYSVKSKDYLSHSDNINASVLDALVIALSRRHLFEFSGVFAEVRKRLRLDDIENGDLVHTSDDSRKDSDLLYTMIFRWSDSENSYINIDVIIEDEPSNLRRCS